MKENNIQDGKGILSLQLPAKIQKIVKSTGRKSNRISNKCYIIIIWCTFVYFTIAALYYEELISERYVSTSFLLLVILVYLYECRSKIRLVDAVDLAIKQREDKPQEKAEELNKP